MPHRVVFCQKWKLPAISPAKKIISRHLRSCQAGTSRQVRIYKHQSNACQQSQGWKITARNISCTSFRCLFWLGLCMNSGIISSSSSVVDISHSSSYIKYNTEVVKLSSYPCCSHHLCMHWCASRYDSHWSVAAALLPFRHLCNNWLTSPCVVMVATT